MPVKWHEEIKGKMWYFQRPCRYYLRTKPIINLNDITSLKPNDLEIKNFIGGKI